MKSWRAWVPVFAVGLPIALALVCIFLFLDGAIGMATVIAACFALGAIAVTSLMMHREEGEDRDEAPWLRQ